MQKRKSLFQTINSNVYNYADCRDSRKGNPRLARQSDHRGRSSHRFGCIRTRSRAERRIDGRARSARAPRRRQGPLPGQGRTERRQECQRGDRPGHHRHERCRPGGYRQGHDRARRYAYQVEARRKRHPRRVAGRCTCRCRLFRHAALPLYRRRERQDAARPDDEHHQRRFALGRPDRIPGVHDPSRGCPHVQGGYPHGRRGIPQPEEGAPQAQPFDGGR